MSRSNIYLDLGDYLEKMVPRALKIVLPEPGATYRVVEVNGSRSALLDNYLLIRQGDSLVVDFQAGVKLQLKDFYQRCEESRCGITLPIATSSTVTMTAEDREGMQLPDGSTLIFLHGENQQVLMQMIGQNRKLQPVDQCLDLAYQVKYYNQQTDEEEGEFSAGMWGTLVATVIGVGATGLADDTGTLKEQVAAHNDQGEDGRTIDDLADLKDPDNPDVTDPADGEMDIDSSIASQDALALLSGREMVIDYAAIEEPSGQTPVESREATARVDADLPSLQVSSLMLALSLDSVDAIGEAGFHIA